MALTFLLDTSVLKRLSRAEVRAVIGPLAARGEIGRAGVCDLEVGFSARNEAEWDELVGALEAFEPLETTAAHVRRALQVQRLLARRSKRGRKIPDLHRRCRRGARPDRAALRRGLRPDGGRHRPVVLVGRSGGQRRLTRCQPA